MPVIEIYEDDDKALPEGMVIVDMDTPATRVDSAETKAANAVVANS